VKTLSVCAASVAPIVNRLYRGLAVRLASTLSVPCSQPQRRENFRATAQKRLVLRREGVWPVALDVNGANDAPVGGRGDDED
jgi:hypothetical protein